MSKIALIGNTSGTGTLTIAAPNTSTDRTITLPDASGTINTMPQGVNNVSASSDYTVTFPTTNQWTNITYTADNLFTVLPVGTSIPAGLNYYQISSTPSSGGTVYEEVTSGELIRSSTGTLTRTYSYATTPASNVEAYGISIGMLALPQTTSVTTTTTAQPSFTWLTQGSSFVIGYLASGGQYVVAGTLSGSVVTLGTPVLLGTSTAAVPPVCALSTTLVGAVYSNTTSTVVRPISVSGTTLTLGTASAANSGNGAALVALSSTTALFLGTGNTRVVTFSGTSAPTLGTSVTTNYNAPINSYCGVLLDTNKVLTMGGTYSQVSTVSGTTVTLGTAVSTQPPSTNVLLSGRAYKISATEGLVIGYDQIGGSDGNSTFKLAISGTTITKTSGSPISSGLVTYPAQLSTTEYLLRDLYSYNNSTVSFSTIGSGFLNIFSTTDSTLVFNPIDSSSALVMRASTGNLQFAVTRKITS